ncbi:23S rRNA (uridine(2552)-2'-O)-methyltransferase RlmE [Litorivicinus lipolyticus]|jgi:23S rRNA (uridine2552-2'-O)-methyltransferase|uniref:Ribosomal RNA large subunit methyltransferase E n=1 Tax=Litorivicinus lipolyticus TaxID=418701 RepID=A0A5Q2QAZ4_9GAMM|nr:23S rRNA (uridine(2552)-2'-O)-methyltransferase RlmE [Litorivicinus lipolyticus]QGG79461.1 23S rRNA (uridine(2552)-2'-O)-methyltransferase RlmE [Litorivicinus lipolyticus]
MARSKSSSRWIREHEDDEYVKKARAAGYRSRAAFKLIEIQERDRLIKPNQTVVDLGAAPGGWSQMARQWIGRNGILVASDILEMDAMADVDFVQGDFTEAACLDELLGVLDGREVDVVISDMAPNMSGNTNVDMPRAMVLCELALEFARTQLRPGGTFLIKVFQGEGFETFLKECRASFAVVKSRKPKASRPRSRELYLLGTDFRG